MRRFHSLTVTHVAREAEDAMRVGLQVPPELREQFRFLPGQHLPLQVVLQGRKIRRTYSICSAPGQWPLEIGVRLQPGGLFSGHVGEELASGSTLEAMPPFGQFHVDPDMPVDAAGEVTGAKTRVAFAAGSGITPILSILRATLEMEPASRFLLFYGNRRQRTTMFIEDLYALKNRFPERLQLNFLFSREEQEFPLMSGRLDASKVRELWQTFCSGCKPDEAFVCGPDTMIDTVGGTLTGLGMDEAAIRVERYGVPRRRRAPQAAAPSEEPSHLAQVTVIMDGHEKTFAMSALSPNIVDAAAEQGIELPYSCKAGVCATCRTWLREGEVRMNANYGLEPWEVDKGFVLACQSRPLTDRVVLDYDKV
jgi:ring-1,2-phenylacetyl-CoA epoxidase subunit PaaE